MIKQPWLLVVSLLCLVAAAVLAVERVMFLSTAEKTMGQVTDIDARNDRCGSKKTRYDCTEFRATVRYAPPTGGQFRITISAGSSRGHNQPISHASYAIGHPVEVVYSPTDPSRAYQNTLFGVWGAPLIAAGAQIATLFGSMSEGRRRRSVW